MKIKQEFDYYAEWDELAKEFTENDSVYQAQVINRVGETFQKWVKEGRAFTHVQLLEIAEELDEDGKWFIEAICDYVEAGTEVDE